MTEQIPNREQFVLSFKPAKGWKDMAVIAIAHEGADRRVVEESSVKLKEIERLVAPLLAQMDSHFTSRLTVKRVERLIEARRGKDGLAPDESLTALKDYVASRDRINRLGRSADYYGLVRLGVSALHRELDKPVVRGFTDFGYAPLQHRVLTGVEEGRFLTQVIDAARKSAGKLDMEGGIIPTSGRITMSKLLSLNTVLDVAKTEITKSEGPVPSLHKIDKYIRILLNQRGPR